VVETLSSDGVPTDTEAGTPSPLPNQRTADGLEAIELELVLEAVAGFAAGPLGAARVEARRPTLDLEWIRRELARVGEVAAFPALSRGCGSRAACSTARSSSPSSGRSGRPGGCTRTSAG
jgi:hypothetical protein